MTDGPGQRGTERFAIRSAANADGPHVRAIVERVLREYGLAPSPGDTDADLADLEANYLDRGGAFWVVESPSGVVGCAGLYPVDHETMELRKMYLLPEARGRGLGRRLLRSLVAEARARGAKRVVLETASVLREAIELYRSMGFVPVEREHLAARCDQGWVLDLDGADDPG
jgi:putative acetyltransferase